MKKLFCLVLTGALAACSNGGGGGGSAGPANSINSKISPSGAQALSGLKALFEAGLSQNNRMKNADVRGLLQGLQANAAADDQSKAETRRKYEVVNRAMKSNQCKMDLRLPQNSGSAVGMAAEFPRMNLKVSGAGCAIEMVMDIRFEGSADDVCQTTRDAQTCKFVGIVKMDYRVLDENLKQELQVSSGQLNMRYAMEQTMPGQPAYPGRPGRDGQNGPGQEGLNMTRKGNGSVDMKAVDLANRVYVIAGKSDFNMQMIMEGSGQESAPNLNMSLTMKEELSFVDEAANISSSFLAAVAVNGNSATESYLIDGVAVTGEVYQAEREKFANSMMAFERQEQDDKKNPDSNPGGNDPTPSPRPPTNPPSYPPNNPVNPPANPPSNPTNPGSGRWVCGLKNYSTSQIFLGYGEAEFVAKSKAIQNCQAAGSASSCSSTAECEKQSNNPRAWYCTNKNYSSSAVFDSYGASEIEASYLARQSCGSQSGSNASSCASSTECSQL